MTGRRNVPILVAFWLAFSILITTLSWHALQQRQFPDPDDVMRLLQVRDWIGGQSWFDVTQYRLNPPAGVPMHWSRLVDVPIASVILLTRPFVGEWGAETAALVAIPLLTLGIVMLLVNAIGCRLANSKAALVAAIATPFSLGTLKQMRPMRIDHHGWQIVMALAAILAVLDRRQRRSGATAGIAMALWLNISIEGLPFAAAVGALFAWRWLQTASEAERLKAYLASLAVSSLLLFGLTHYPSTWLTQPRDVVTSAHLAAFTVAALIAGFAVRPTTSDWRSRLAVLASVGIGTLAAIFSIDPHWLKGPFGSLPPLVKEMWYNQIDEGLPVWQVGWDEAAAALAQPLVGIIGALLAVRSLSGEERKRWVGYLFLLLAATGASAYVLRFGTTSSIIALPATAYLCQRAYRGARKLSVMPVRVVATTGALCIMTPAFAVPLTVAPVNDRLQNAVKASDFCTRRTEIEKLRSLPKGEIAAPVEIAPALLLSTDDNAVATGHHRNASGINDVLELFLYAPSQGARIIARRHVDYVVFCPNAPESIRFANRGPGGLAEMLQAGKAPAWLHPLDVPGLHGLKVWRVQKDLITA
jgi:CDP-diglyceride synthetase